MVQFLEIYSDDDGDDDDVKIRNYSSAFSSPIATHDYDNNNEDTSSSSDHRTVVDSGGVGSNNEYEDNDDNAKDANHDDNDDDTNDTNDAHDNFSYFASSDESPSSYQSSVCDGTHSQENYNNDEDNNYSFAYASSSPCLARSNNHNALVSTSNAINVSNNLNAVSGSDDDIMSLSFTNQSLQPNVSASDSSSFIGPCCNLECNAHLKVKRYDIGEDSSDDETEWSSSDEHVWSVV